MRENLRMLADKVAIGQFGSNRKSGEQILLPKRDSWSCLVKNSIQLRFKFVPKALSLVFMIMLLCREGPCIDQKKFPTSFFASMFQILEDRARKSFCILNMILSSDFKSKHTKAKYEAQNIFLK